MSINKTVIALAIISASVGLNAPKALAQSAPKQSSHITYTSSAFSANGEADSDEDSSPVYLTNIRVKTENREVPVVMSVDPSNNLPNSLYVGTGICARAGLKSIGWVENYASPSGQAVSADQGTIAVKLDSSGKIAKRIIGTVADVTVIGVYCVRSMDAATNYSCQFSTAKNAKSGLNEADTSQQFSDEVRTCMEKQAAASAPAKPTVATPAAPVVVPAADLTITTEQAQQ